MPTQIRTGNGPEFISGNPQNMQGITSKRYIEPGKPAQNAYIERFNRSYRSDVIDKFSFETIENVRHETRGWTRKYNHERLHGTLGNLTQAEYLAINSTETCNFDWC